MIIEFSVSDIKTLFDVLYNKRAVLNITLIDNRKSSTNSTTQAHAPYGEVGTVEYYMRLEYTGQQSNQYAAEYQLLNTAIDHSVTIDNSNSWTLDELVQVIRTGNCFNCDKLVNDCVIVFKTLDRNEEDWLQTLIILTNYV